MTPPLPPALSPPASAPIAALAPEAAAGTSAIIVWAVLITLAMLVVGGLAAAFRVARGPSLADRVVALDLMGTLIVGGIAVYALLEQQAILLWVAITLALLLFVSTVAFAQALGLGLPDRVTGRRDEVSGHREDAEPAEDQGDRP